MSDKRCYYFDTNVLYKHYIFSPSDSSVDIIHQLSADHLVHISNLTYLEMLGVLARHVRKKLLSKDAAEQVIERLKTDIGTTTRHRFQLVPTQEGVFQSARALIIEYAMKYELSTNDALHITIAKHLDPAIIMVTSDGGKSAGKMKGVCAEIKLEVFDPEQENISSQSVISADDHCIL